MKRIFGVFAVMLCMGVLLMGCSSSKDSEKVLKGTASEVLNELISKATEISTDEEYGIGTIGVSENVIDKDEVEDVLGLNEDEFNEYVEDAVESKPENSWYNHSVVVVKLKEGTNVKDVAEKIVANTSPSRFGCLKAPKIEGAYSENYVIFAASDEGIVDTVIKAFKDITNDNVQVITRENNWNTSFFDEQ